MSVDELSLRGKSAIVTGGSQGIGRAVALTLARRGAKLMITARGALALEKVAEEIRHRGGEARSLAGDLAEAAHLDNVVQTASDAFGTVDILVNNAGLMPVAAFTQTSKAQFDAAMQVNVWAPFRLSCLCREKMKAGGGGVIVNITSIAAIRPTPGLCAYAASKSALGKFTDLAALEWGEEGIRLVSIAPGLIDTEMGSPSVKMAAESGKKLNPLNRAGEPDEIAQMVAFLASDAAGFANAQSFVFDGGTLASGPF